MDKEKINVKITGQFSEYHGLLARTATDVEMANMCKDALVLFNYKAQVEKHIFYVVTVECKYKDVKKVMKIITLNGAYEIKVEIND